MVFGTKNMWLPLMLSLISFEVCRGSMNVIVLNINGGGADVSETAPLNIDEEEAGEIESTAKQGKEYFVYEHSGAISIDGAIDACINENGHAVVPENLEEAEEIKQLATMQVGNYYIPTGLTYENGGFVLEDNTPYTGSVPTMTAAAMDQYKVFLTVTGDSLVLQAVSGTTASPYFTVICEKNTN